MIKKKLSTLWGEKNTFCLTPKPPFTVLFVERNYNPFLVNIVKVPQTEVKVSVDTHQSFLQVDWRTCRDR